jgi:hypothetical protein
MQVKSEHRQKIGTSARKSKNNSYKEIETLIFLNSVTLSVKFDQFIMPKDNEA